MVSEIAYVISLRHLAMDKLIAAEDPVPLPAAGISSAARHFPSPGHNVRGIHRLHSPLSSVYGVLGNNASYPCKEEIYAMPSEMEIDN